MRRNAPSSSSSSSPNHRIFLAGALRSRRILHRHCAMQTICVELFPRPSMIVRRPRMWDLLRSKFSTTTKPIRRPPSRSATGARRNNARPRPTQLQTEWPYGLQRVDYSKLPPKWPLPIPPPPRKNPIRRNFPYAVLALFTGFFVYIYINRDEEVYEYWRQVEQGNVPLGDDEEDDEDDD